MTDVPIERDFTQINNLTDIDIEWREGPCNVTFVGSAFLLADYDIEVDDAGLTVNLVGKPGDASLLITSPTLNLLSNYGNGTIRLRGTLHSESLEIGNMEDGAIEGDTLCCQHFTYQSQHASTARFDLLQGNEVTILADGEGSTDVTLDVERLNLQAWGTQTVTLQGRAKHKEISVSRTNMVNNLLK